VSRVREPGNKSRECGEDLGLRTLTKSLTGARMGRYKHGTRNLTLRSAEDGARGPSPHSVYIPL